MSFSWTTNTTPATGTVAMKSLLDKLVAQGGIVKADSDGSTYASAGGQVTGSGSGAHGLANTNAWMRIQMPSGIEWLWQRGTADYAWRGKLSMSAHFTGGSPSATQVPSATDEVVFCGGGTDAAPSFPSLFATTNGTYRFNLGVDTSGMFWSCGFTTGGGTISHGMAFDLLTNGAASDGFMGLIYCGISNCFAYNGAFGLSTAAPTSPNVCLATIPKLTPAGTDFINFPAMSYANKNFGTYAVPRNLPTNPLTGNDEPYPIPFMRDASLVSPGYKGIGQMLKWHGQNRANVGDLITVATTRDRILFNDMSLPWDGSVLTL